MLTIRDSLRLAVLKFKARKIRSILSMVVFSLGVITIIIFLLGTASIRDILWQAYPDRYGTHFALIEWHGGEYNSRDGTQNKTDLEISIPSISEFRSLYQDRYDIKGIYKRTEIEAQVRLTEYESKSILDGKQQSQEEEMDYFPHLLVIDPYLSKESVFQGYSLENKYGGKIPLILNARYAKNILLGEESVKDLERLYSLAEGFDSDVLKEIHELQRRLHQYIGKEFTVSIAIDGSEKFSFKGIIVGYVGSLTVGLPDRFRLDTVNTALIIPNWAGSVNEDIAGMLSNRGISKSIGYVVEFDSIEKRYRFVEGMKSIKAANSTVDRFASEPTNNPPSDKGDRCDIGTRCYVSDTEDEIADQNNGSPHESGNIVEIDYYTYDLVSVQEFFDKILQPLLYMVICLASVFLIVGMAFVTINVFKILADSRKEIGIFRAVGAQQSDIVKIFMSYIFVVLSGGFFVSLMIAVIINISLSLFFGDAVYYSFVAGSSQVSLVKPLFVFVGFPYVELSVFYIILMVTGFLAGIVPVLLSSKRNVVDALRSE
ncbi:MAG: hypothetical protein KatS3mg083_464 [Candidatus Dojkabacteria bacterium]|nr:MAG: hypothetical protein KatS3mg083_464 [Candidatus Dojkabacteria bacterium]